MATIILGVDPIPVPDNLLLDYTLSSKKVSVGPASKSGWLTDGVYIEDPVERLKMEKSLRKIHRQINDRILLRNSIFAITKFKDRRNWEAIRVRAVEGSTNIYAPLVEGLIGSAKIVVSEGNCNLSYYSKNCISEELIS